MTIKEIKEKRLEFEKQKQEKLTDYNVFVEANERIMKDLDLQGQVAHDELVKRIKGRFTGITPCITVSETQLKITFENLDIVRYEYDVFSFSAISRNLAKAITKDYEDVYGEPEEEKLPQNIYSRFDFLTNQ